MNDEVEAKKKEEEEEAAALQTKSDREFKETEKKAKLGNEGRRRGEKNKAQHQKLTSRSFRQKVREMF